MISLQTFLQLGKMFYRSVLSQRFAQLRSDKIEVHGRARREAARRRNTEWTVNLAIRNCSPNNATCQMTPKTVL